jgi:hypothetical protein
MSRNWTRYEGRFAGGWQMETFLGERDDTAYFIAHNGVGPRSSLLQVVIAGSPGANAALASWTLAKRLTSEHILRVRGAGEEDVEDLQRVVWAAMDLPDDDLSEMAPRRPLETGELRDIVHAVALALEYLHEEGLSHGALLPSNIFLVEGTWRISVDSLAPADGASKLADVRQLGADLVWAATGGADSPSERPSAESVARVPMPLRDIAIGCLERGWTATQAVAALEGRYAPPGGEAPEVPPATPKRPAPPPRKQEPAARRSSLWPVLTAVVAVLVLVVAFALNGRASRNVTASTTPVPAAAPVTGTQAAPDLPVATAPPASPAENGSADR